MKYSIAGFSQEKLLDFNLDIIDAYILRWFVDFQPKMMAIDIDGSRFYWAKYKAVISDLPTIGINNERSIARRFDKLVDMGVMEKCVTDDARHLTCFKLTQKYLELVGSSKAVKGMDAKVQANTSDARACTQEYKGMDAKVQAPVLKSTHNINKTHLLDSSTNIDNTPNPQKGANDSQHNLVVDEFIPLPKRQHSKLEHEVAIETWVQVIDKLQIKFTSFELDAIMDRARAYPKMQEWEIVSELKQLDKWAWQEGLDIEDAARCGYRKLMSVRTQLRKRVKQDAQGNAILNIDQLNAIRLNEITQQLEVKKGNNEH